MKMLFLMLYMAQTMSVPFQRTGNHIRNRREMDDENWSKWKAVIIGKRSEWKSLLNFLNPFTSWTQCLYELDPTCNFEAT